MIEIKTRIDTFVKQVSDHFGNRLTCMILTGSHARGEASPDSDIDIWVFFDHVRNDDLRNIGKIIQGLGPGPEINPQCVSFAEVTSGIFRDQFSPLQLHVDGIVLYGELALPKPAKAEILKQIRTIVTFVMMSARHYITVQESEKSLANGKLQKWILKPLMWALRYEVLWRKGEYPRSLNNLKQTAFSEDARQCVDTYQCLLNATYSSSYLPEVERASNVAASLLQTVEIDQ